MSVNDLSRNRKAHASPGNAITHFLPPIELIEDRLLFVKRNPGSLIFYMHRNEISLPFR